MTDKKITQPQSEECGAQEVPQTNMTRMTRKNPNTVNRQEARKNMLKEIKGIISIFIQKGHLFKTVMMNLMMLMKVIITFQMDILVHLNTKNLIDLEI